jgi:hypothetical protein
LARPSSSAPLSSAVAIYRRERCRPESVNAAPYLFFAVPLLSSEPAPGRVRVRHRTAHLSRGLILAQTFVDDLTQQVVLRRCNARLFRAQKDAALSILSLQNKVDAVRLRQLKGENPAIAEILGALI